jgi:hypothetical protein
MRAIISFLILAVLFCFCSDRSESSKANSGQLQSLVVQALSGNSNANKSLSGLIDSDHIGKNQYNQLKIDSAIVDNKIFYSILLEYPEPILNLFAVYDEDLRFYLLDNSLNGNISVEWKPVNRKNIIFVQEKFLTKDVLALNRLSIYMLKDTIAELAFRTFTQIVKDKDTLSQSITQIIEDNLITTRISTGKEKALTNQVDTFYYNGEMYLSKQEVFSNLVKEEIKNFRWIPIKPHLSSGSEDESTFSGNGYRILLNSDWKKIPDFIQFKYLKEKLTGTRFLSNSLDASISVYELPAGRNGEYFSKYEFEKTEEGPYEVRFTRLRRQGDSFFQIYEYSCSSKKFLLIFECPRNTHEKNRNYYDSVIKSFLIEC